MIFFLLFVNAFAAQPNRVAEGLNHIRALEQLAVRTMAVVNDLNQLAPLFTADSGIPALIAQFNRASALTHQVCNMAETVARTNPEDFVQSQVFQVGRLGDGWADRLSRLLKILPDETAAVSGFEGVFEGLYDEWAAMRISISVFMAESDFQDLMKKYGMSGSANMRINHSISTLLQYLAMELPIIHKLVTNVIDNGRTGSDTDRAFLVANSGTIRSLMERLGTMRILVTSAIEGGPAEPQMTARLPQLAATGALLMGELDILIGALPAARENNLPSVLYELRKELKVKSRDLAALLRRAAI